MIATVGRLTNIEVTMVCLYYLLRVHVKGLIR